MKKTKIYSRYCVLIVFAMLFSSYGNKKSHPYLNRLIVQGFANRYVMFDHNPPRFKNYNFYLSSKRFPGDFILRSGMFSPNDYSEFTTEQKSYVDKMLQSLIVDGVPLSYVGRYTEDNTEYTAQGWIEHGGVSADVPEIHASLRHFYDPTQKESKRYLTDDVNNAAMLKLQSYLKNPEINGVDWALGDKAGTGVFEHNYSWVNGKKYMKAALEEANLEKRNMYMAKAWRSLGETLHMIADNGCPPHVRNDAHPLGNVDPYEEYIEASDVRMFNTGKVPDDLKYVFSKSTTTRKIAHDLAVFTNENFFSNETISGDDKKMREVKQIAHPNYVYDTPKLNNMVYEDEYYDSKVGDNQVFHCTDKWIFSVWNIGRTLAPYIDGKCIQSQARVLVPTIVEAGINVMKLYIPELKVNITQVGEDGEIKGQIFHKTDKEYTNQIQYNGPVLIQTTNSNQRTELTASNGKFEGKIKVNEDATVHAEIEFGGVIVCSDDFEIKANEDKEEEEEVSGDGEYAWYFVGVKDIHRTKELEAKNKSYKNTYKYTLNYSRGSIHESQTYIGKTDTWYNPPRTNGEGLDIQCKWSEPPKIIRAGDKVGINVSISAPRNNLSSLSMGGHISASGLLYREGESDAEAVIRFTGQKCKSSVLSCNSKTKFKAETDVFYTEPFNENQMGDYRTNKLIIRVTGGMSVGSGTEYIYERKQNK